MTAPPDQPTPTRPAVRARLTAWILASLALLFGTPAWLWLIRGPRLLDHHATLFAGWLALGSAVVAVLWLLRTTPPDAVRVPDRAGRWVVVGGAAWLQVCAVALLMPVLSEDALRFRLDGKLWLLGVSPYAHAPDDVAARSAGSASEGDALRPDSIDRRVTYPELSTIYLPAGEAAFAAARAVEFTLLPGPPPVGEGDWRDVAPRLPFADRLLVYRVLFGACAVAATGVLVNVLRRRRQSVWAAALFGWNPLVVIEAGGMAHQDFLGVLLLLAAFRSLGRVQFGRACFLLMAAALVKPLALLLLPWFLRDAVRRGRRFRRAAIGGAVPLALAAPAWLYQGGYAGWWATMSAYAKVWEANGGVYALVTSAGVGPVAARAVGGLLVLGVAAWLWRRRADAPAAGYGVLAALLLVSPVAYPWYVAWALCLVPLMRRAGWAVVVWSATAGLSYQLWPASRATGLWELPPGWLLAEYAPVAVALGVDAAIALRRTRGRARGVATEVATPAS